MKQTSTITRAMTTAQENHAIRNSGRTFRIYTENVPDFDYLPVINRYFVGATLYAGQGVWHGNGEPSLVIEIVGGIEDLQRITNLAGDIRQLAGQSLVLVSWSKSNSLEVIASC